MSILEKEQLLRRYPLPPNYTKPEFFEEETQVLGARIFLLGVLTRNLSGEILTGSAGSLRQKPLERAYFELLERVTIDEKESAYQSEIPTWRLSRSNGVALGRNFTDASERAALELWERDKILHSWYWSIAPSKVDLEVELLPHMNEKYDVFAASFSKVAPFVVGIFCFPKYSENPFAYGFGSAHSMLDAQKKATSEMVQRLGFLWGESIPLENPPLQPTAVFHQEYFLVPENFKRVRSWLVGEGEIRATSFPFSNSLKFCEIKFEDFTPSFLQKELCVVRASAKEALPLSFGYSETFSKELGIPFDRAIHPIA